MSDLTDQQIRALLIDIISDGFNRSLAALEQAGAVNTKTLKSAYSGTGSKYYDLVTEQISYTAEMGTAALRALLASGSVRGGS